MKPETPIKQLDELHKEENALEQSVALNRIVMTMLESKRREDYWLRIILIISLLVNVVVAGIFVAYERSIPTTTTTTTETTTVEQDTGEGSGNNVYQSGENASYSQGSLEEVKPDGEANSNYYSDDYNDNSGRTDGSNNSEGQPVG